MITHQAIEDDNISTKKSEHMANHSVQCHICVTFIVASGLPGRGLRNGSRIVSPILVTVEVLELKYIRKIYITRLILKASSPYSTINGTVFGEGEHCNWVVVKVQCPSFRKAQEHANEILFPLLNKPLHKK
jgi:hypothetical protein